MDTDQEKLVFLNKSNIFQQKMKTAIILTEK